jgi:hypothetical protein
MLFIEPPCCAQYHMRRSVLSTSLPNAGTAVNHDRDADDNGTKPINHERTQKNTKIKDQRTNFLISNL